MTRSCLQVTGFLLSCLGIVAIVIAVSTSEWVLTCRPDVGLNTCKKMDELESKGPWAECIISTGQYHCVYLTQILDLPVYIQVTRALMITGSILGVPALGLLLMSMPCISLGSNSSQPENSESKHTILGGVLILIAAFCSLISTVWFPIGSHHQFRLMSFGYSLYVGWVGTIFSLLGGSILTCCSSESSSYQDNNRFYYSRQGGSNPPPNATNNHAKTAHV